MAPKFKKPATQQSTAGPRPSVFVPVWTWDPHYVYRARVGLNRWKFLLESQQDLSDSYTKLNSRQKLHVVRENPETVLAKLVKKWAITHLVFEKDTDAYARSRDDSVTKQVRDLGVEVIIKMGRTLFDPDELVKNNGNKPTMSMKQVLAAAAKIGDGKPAKPLSAPKDLPDPLSQDEMDLTELDHQIPSPSPDFNAAQRGKSKNEKHYHSITGPNKDFAVVTLEEMGMDPAAAKSPHKGGETEALRLLKKYIDDEDYIGNFEKPNSPPTDFDPQSTTLLSPHHHFGSLSVRKFWWDVQDVFERRKKQGKHNAGEPANFPGQLLFRDMYFGAQAALGWAFAQTQGNKVARFIPWHLQSNYSSEPLGEHLLDGTYTVDDEEAEEWFRRWKEARTGFPWIDALMRQLRDEGWIHHLGRHALACFLTRGGCYVHWERGAEVFEEYLIDHETACNVGNWMWLSCTAFFSQFYRCYSPVSFPKKWDPDGHFIRQYVPELRNYDKKYIFEPHKAPIADQKKWGCQIQGDGTGSDTSSGLTYPKPMFDFNRMRQYCLDNMKAAYDTKLYGDDPKVMSGEWKKIFNYPDSGQVKDETHGRVGAGHPSGDGGGEGDGGGKHGTKRRRPQHRGQTPDQQHSSDDGEHADTGDLSGDEAAPPRRKAAKSGGGSGSGDAETSHRTGRSGKDSKRGKQGKQGTLDSMVDRKKR